MSGSENRQRTRIVQFRVSDPEHDALIRAAESADLPIGSYARKVLLNARPSRVKRTPSYDVVALTRLLGEFGKVGSNLNQIARLHNAGRPDFIRKGELEETLRELESARTALMNALKPPNRQGGPS